MSCMHKPYLADTTFSLKKGQGLEHNFSCTYMSPQRFSNILRGTNDISMLSKSSLDSSGGPHIVSYLCLSLAITVHTHKEHVLYRRGPRQRDSNKAKAYDKTAVPNRQAGLVLGEEKTTELLNDVVFHFFPSFGNKIFVFAYQNLLKYNIKAEINALLRFIFVFCFLFFFINKIFFVSLLDNFVFVFKNCNQN